MVDRNRLKFGRHVARLRRQSMMTQEQLAEAAGLRACTVRNLEDGKFNVPFDVLNRVAVVLGGELQIVINESKEL